ncbi:MULTISPECIES: hypothetical protein [Geobacillus]|uniref:Uncharacterized protein n=1 Tax=Geobacillus thermocatenulatus TaxID=33938 RepID=A0A226QCL2_9BACL|nr:MULTISPECIES: hypothetical protein [Geobacillus]ASS98664.1 hypothetical protein GT3921_06195 [Geobacillus thermocatenulatus]KLR73921.1 hypothetical protein ABH20_08345 [Geobacillus sp. T6]OXB89417.1 hypothetical protein B9L19_04950 [Geobacillus thermocatenulatus]RAN22590.1 hypothetical protein VC88_10370 [Geobacillus sp. A8]
MATKAGDPLATESGGSSGLSFMYGFGASGSSLKSVFLCLQTERRALFVRQILQTLLPYYTINE